MKGYRDLLCGEKREQGLKELCRKVVNGSHNIQHWKTKEEINNAQTICTVNLGSVIHDIPSMYIIYPPVSVQRSPCNLYDDGVH